MPRLATAAAALAALALVAAAPVANSAFDLTMTTIDGKPMPLAQYRGKVLLVVNTASFCGYTPQYEGLEKLYQSYARDGLVVIGVPSNDFEQEQADNKKIKEFCDTKFGIKFPLAERSNVTGPKAAPFFAWAGAQMGQPKWNFYKYLVGRDGKLIAAYSSKVAPESPALQDAVKKALVAKA